MQPEEEHVVDALRDLANQVESQKTEAAILHRWVADLKTQMALLTMERDAAMSLSTACVSNVKTALTALENGDLLCEVVAAGILTAAIQNHEAQATSLPGENGNIVISTWRERCLSDAQNSDPQNWPDNFIIQRIQAEINDLRKAANVFSAT